MMSASETIKKIRMRLGLEQTEFGDEIGVSGSTVSSWECGIRVPRIKTIRRMKELADKNNIKVKIEDFLDDMYK